MLARARRGDKQIRLGRSRGGIAEARAERDPVPEPGATPEPDADPSRDTAVYSCECGFVFEALVNTSVGCPNCGASQAW